MPKKKVSSLIFYVIRFVSSVMIKVGASKSNVFVWNWVNRMKWKKKTGADRGSNFTIDIDCMIMAIGTSPNPLIRHTTKGLEVNRKGCFICDEDGLRKNIYAGGDAVSGDPRLSMRWEPEKEQLLPLIRN